MPVPLADELLTHALHLQRLPLPRLDFPERLELPPGFKGLHFLPPLQTCGAIRLIITALSTAAPTAISSLPSWRFPCVIFVEQASDRRVFSNRRRIPSAPVVPAAFLRAAVERDQRSPPTAGLFEKGSAYGPQRQPCGFGGTCPLRHGHHPCLRRQRTCHAARWLNRPQTKRYCTGLIELRTFDRPAGWRSVAIGFIQLKPSRTAVSEISGLLSR